MFLDIIEIFTGIVVSLVELPLVNVGGTNEIFIRFPLIPVMLVDAAVIALIVCPCVIFLKKEAIRLIILLTLID